MNPREIQLEEVQSSNIAALGYDAENKTCVVEFKGRIKYSISPMEQSDYDALRYASSIGKYYHAFIRNNGAYDIIRL